MANDDIENSQRQTPNRSMGESDLRLYNTAADFDGDELEMFNQLVHAEGYSNDLNSDVFESRLADKSLIARRPLSEQEYFNTKLKLAQAELDDPLAALEAMADERVKRALGGTDVVDPELAASKRAEIWQRWQTAIDQDVEQGQTLEEAYRAQLYRLRAGRRLELDRLLAGDNANSALGQGSLSNTEYLNRKSQLAAEAEQLISPELERYLHEWVSVLGGNQDAQIEHLQEVCATSIKQLMDKDGLSLAEAQNRVLYQLRTQHEIRKQSPRIDLFDVVRRMIEDEPIEPLETKALVEKVMVSVGEMDELIGMCAEHYPGNSPIREAVLKGAVGQQFTFGDQPSYGFAREGFTQDLHLPFKVCTFILPKIHKGSKLVVVAEQLRENQILLTAFHKTPEVDAAWYPLISRRRLHMNKGKLKVMEIGDGVHKLAGELYNRAVNAVLGFLHSQANQTSVRLHKNFTPPEAGEVNLLDGYSVVYMSGVIPIPNEPLGGTHASPREHDRRGHWRRTSSGRVWIEPMVINKGVGGRVEKTYRVSGHKTHQPDR